MSENRQNLNESNMDNFMIQKVTEYATAFIVSSSQLTTTSNILHHLEGSGTVGNKSRAGLGNTVRKGELEFGGKELLDVGATDVLGLLDLDNAKNLR